MTLIATYDIPKHVKDKRPEPHNQIDHKQRFSSPTSIDKQLQHPKIATDTKMHHVFNLCTN